MHGVLRHNTGSRFSATYVARYQRLFLCTERKVHKVITLCTIATTLFSCIILIKVTFHNLIEIYSYYFTIDIHQLKGTCEDVQLFV